MDGFYRLEHPEWPEEALVRIEGRTFSFREPPGELILCERSSHEEAQKAAGEKLMELMAAGWEISHVETEESLQEEDNRRSTEESFDDEEAPDPEEALLRHGPLVRIDAAFADVEPALVGAVVEEAFVGYCEQLYIHQSAVADAPWFATVSPWCDALGVVGSEELRALIIDTYYNPLTRQAGVYCGDITPIFEGCPNLEFAHIVGYCELRELRHEQLTWLTLMGESLSPDTVEAVLCGRCPKLKRLALGFGYEQRADPASIERFIELIGDIDLPALRQLHLAVPGDAPRLVEAIAAAKISSQLDALYFHHTTPDDVGSAFLSHADIFSLIPRIGISRYEPALDGATTDHALRRALPRLVDSDDFDIFAPTAYGWRRFEGRDDGGVEFNFDEPFGGEVTGQQVAIYGDISPAGMTLQEAAELQEYWQSRLTMNDRDGLITAASKMLLGGLYAEAIEAYRGIIKKYPELTGDCLGSIGAAYYFLGNFQRAITYYERAKAEGAPADVMDDNIAEAREALEGN